MSDTYNLVVIGAGSGGLISSLIGAAVKAKVALIEKNKMGGDCLNYGCVPSKAIIKSARFVQEIKRHKDYGIKEASFELDFSEVMERVQDKIKRIEPHDSVERYTSLGVECFQGEAEIIDAHTVKVGDKVLKTKNIVLAMGASPFVPPIKNIDSVEYLTSENLWDIRELPKRLVILGGGPIGCEMAQAFNRLGSEVTQVEMADRILPREDDDIAKFVIDRMREEGVQILHKTAAKEVTQENGENLLLCDAPGGQKKIPFDKILIAVGRKANTQGVDWQRLGIDLNPNGTIKVDEYLRSTKKNIYACGDIAGPYQFTHVASHQAWYCSVNALFSPFKKFKVDYRVISWVTFTDPEIAQVGMNEKAAKEAGVPYEVYTYDMTELDRAITESEDYGMIKVLTKPGTDKIIGATIVSHLAGELIGEFVTAMKYNIGLNKILGTIHAYPTFIEANKGVAGVWKRATAPQWALSILEKFHKMRR
ncbi:dihydrolipoyl dehydrogenase family protein [Pseudobacteriovorax antillogorgiicola]|uniref:Pyruvate/2-oxoglutarate dehydrogenase complex, dihydrolipoamide dehydrogenase (E3) component n=1 Tax=Pseudobacteriovorax antillogorgiicola TaxID=1513793 RepID=A0A1Y6BPM7_9BACT|nr:FAD-dependent oxidoreductase [Pseudobacteriovorax antillogorgiicola]TCS53833.1 pyruvate/2-oxoglutarate dehydrogenase complex dihydrolipoamide dehydrogenase (E3) component [Pseudobacteriovorax antillogorgiicola]SMF21735.1 Pyruvate/2-oxoglutarate dehydrogenase complex, dihydrolipoamide dehydrogenase (E3) component [Pseudobacteriovorax antillogorgiicola]